MITLHDVTYTYQDEKDGVQDINITIKPGECVLLCGRSGCGKTTLTRLINGLIPHFFPGKLAGRVTLDSVDLAEMPMYAIAEKVGSVFQNPRTQFFNVDTDSEIAFCMENLSYPVETILARMQKTVKDLRAESLLGRSIFALSGGEKQKVAFASVYAPSPDVYVLDEPSSNLDVASIDQVREILLLLKQQGKTIVIAEHRLYYLQEIVDRIIYLDKGRIAAEYTVEQFLALDSAAAMSRGLRTMDLHKVVLAEQRNQPNFPVLTVEKLTLKYEKNIVLEDVNLAVAKGDVVGIIGRNGAGKSTFSKVLCGLQQEFSGTFCYHGKPVAAKQRLKLAYMVMQDVNYQLFAESVEEECSLGVVSPEPNMIVDVLKELDLYECRSRHPVSLSGGQKQRTAIAAGILCNKEILIFDEPTSGLDFDGMKQVSKLLTQLTEMGKIVFVVTHDYEFIALACNRVIHFDGGRLQDDFAINRQNSKKLRDFFVR